MGQGSIPAVIAASMRNVYPSVKPRTQKTREMSVPENPVSAAERRSSPVGIHGASNCKKMMDNGVSDRGRCASTACVMTSAETYGQRRYTVAHPSAVETKDQNTHPAGETRLERDRDAEDNSSGITGRETGGFSSARCG